MLDRPGFCTEIPCRVSPPTYDSSAVPECVLPDASGKLFAHLLISMANTILIGAQWGDEGKGKIIDVLTGKADIVVRSQGGNNAGHTVIHRDVKYVLHLIPSGILRRGKICVIGNGVVIDPIALVAEIDGLRNLGITIGGNLLISDCAHLVLPYHRLIDEQRELRQGRARIGTTKRGIGPAYGDKAARTGLRMSDLMQPIVFSKKLQAKVIENNKILQALGAKPISFREANENYLKAGENLRHFVRNTVVYLHSALERGKEILFEGAQGTFLDIDHGTYPYVTSSNTTAGGACTGTGVPPHRMDRVVGVMKAYTTRVGEGALPTEEFDKAVDGLIRFPLQFANHQEAREWALKTLLNRTTFATDGSQIMPTKDFSVPVAVVQVGWFENFHTSEGRYVKDTKLEILTPKDLSTGTGADRQISESEVGLHRFRMEASTLCEYMKAQVNENPASDQSNRPIAFFDNTLVISFADRFKDRQKPYVESVLSMLRCSEESQIPLVGYVDTTFARDLTNMLHLYFGLSAAEKIHDAILFDLVAEDGKMRWGDRTPLYICAREGILDEYKDEIGDLRRRIGFVYIKTNTSVPARIDVPLWVYEAGLLDDVLDIVRAEVIVGNGYPYAIETADAVTVISQKDRETFLRVFQEFTTHENIKLRFSRKALSKSRRR